MEKVKERKKLYKYMKNISQVTFEETNQLFKDAENTYNSVVDKSIEERLEQYLKDPVYERCYKGISLSILNVSCLAGRDFSVKDVVDIFDEVETMLNFVLESFRPEFGISKVVSYLTKKYFSNTSLPSNPIPSRSEVIYDSEKTKGAYICIATMIKVYDKLSEKDEIAVASLQSLRFLVEHYDFLKMFIHTTLWQDVCNRVPPINEPSLHDLRHELGAFQSREDQVSEHITYQKVTLEFLERLFEEYNIAPGSTANQRALLYALITPWKYEGINVALCHRKDIGIPELHEEGVKCLNQHLEKLGMKMRLEVKKKK